MSWLWFGLGTLFGLAVSITAAMLWRRFMRSIDRSELEQVEAARAAVIASRHWSDSKQTLASMADTRPVHNHQDDLDAYPQ